MRYIIICMNRLTLYRQSGHTVHPDVSDSSSDSLVHIHEAVLHISFWEEVAAEPEGMGASGYPLFCNVMQRRGRCKGCHVCPELGKQANAIHSWLTSRILEENCHSATQRVAWQDTSSVDVKHELVAHSKFQVRRITLQYRHCIREWCPQV